ncbi:MAG: uroporphyrinogen decarboxylase family protein [Christensenellales bacterium]|jgi:hypothetical protein
MKTSRKRLDLTINHKDPGEVVLDFGATAITGINAIALDKLRDAYGLPKQMIKVHEPFQLLGMVEEDLRQTLGVDVVEINDGYNMFGFKNDNWKPWWMTKDLQVLVPRDFNVTVDENDGTTYIYPQGDMSAPPSGKLPKDGYYFDNCFRTYKEYDEDTSNGAEDYRDDFSVFTDEKLRHIENTCNHYYNNTDYGIVAGGCICSLGDFAVIPGPGVKYPKGIRFLEDWICAPYEAPDYVHEVFSYQTEIALKNCELFRQACGDKIQVIEVSGYDLGTQRGPYIMTDTYREFYYPYLKKVNDWVHKNTNWKTFYHTCGSIVEFLPILHEMGVDILNPVQCSAEGMDPKFLKETWGDKFTFWGAGVDTQKTLPFSTPEEVYEEVMQRLEVFAPGGGFVFNAIHNVQGPTTAKNLMSMFNAIKDYNAKINLRGSEDAE